MFFHSSSPSLLISLAVLPLEGEPLEAVRKFFLRGIMALKPLFLRRLNMLLESYALSAYTLLSEPVISLLN
jgi:hypothetical protein